MMAARACATIIIIKALLRAALLVYDKTETAITFIIRNHLLVCPRNLI